MDDCGDGSDEDETRCPNFGQNSCTFNDRCFFVDGPAINSNYFGINHPVTFLLTGPTRDHTTVSLR